MKPAPPRPDSLPRERLGSSYLFSLMLNAMLLWVVNAYEFWQPATGGVVTVHWAQIVWAANVTIVTHLIFGTLLMLFGGRLLRRLADLAYAATGMLSIYVFYTVYPLALYKLGGPGLDLFVRIVLFIALLGTAVATVVDLVRVLLMGFLPERART